MKKELFLSKRIYGMKQRLLGNQYKTRLTEYYETVPQLEMLMEYNNVNKNASASCIDCVYEKAVVF